MKICLILYIIFLQTVDYDFSDTYKNDLAKLSNEHYGNGKYDAKLKAFGKFSALDITKFSLKKSILEGYSVMTWSTKKGRRNVIRRASKCIKTPNGLCLNFVGYKFIENRDTYFYISVESQGLMEYSINKVDYHISNESIILGLDEIYFDAKTELKNVLDQ